MKKIGSKGLIDLYKFEHNIELKNCPFCGSTPRVSMNFGCPQIWCDKCCYYLEEHKEETLISIWNKRA